MIGWGLSLAVAIAAAPELRDLLRTPVARRRITMPGKLAELPRGATHYRWIADGDTAPDAPVIVCVHGLTTPSFVWDDIAPALAATGARVLVYDLYGRGYSDRPRGVQDSEFFVSQLTALLDHLDVSHPVTLIGYSMGGAIVAACAAAHPDRVRRAVLIAPGGMGHDLGALCDRAAFWPLIGGWLMGMLYPAQYQHDLDETKDAPAKILKGQRAELNYRGFVRSVHASLRGILGDDLRLAHHSIAQSGLPLLAIWGYEDTVIPLAGRDTLAGWNPQAEHVVIDGAGHDLTYTRSADVLAPLLDWLLRH